MSRRRLLWQKAKEKKHETQNDIFADANSELAAGADEFACNGAGNTTTAIYG
jgi:hypothetical protein